MSDETEVEDGVLPTAGNWDDDYKNYGEGGGQKDNKAEWMAFPKPGKYQIRLVGKYVKYQRHWKPFSSRVITHPTYGNDDPARAAGFYPRTTCAIHIIDRADGKVKILDKSMAFFKNFHNFKANEGIDPADRNKAPDWEIVVEWPNNNKRQAKYTVSPKLKLSGNSSTPLTDEEVAMLKENQFDLKKIYKSTPLEKIKELWSQLPEDAKIPPKKETKESENKKYEEYNNDTPDAFEEADAEAF